MESIERTAIGIVALQAKIAARDEIMENVSHDKDLRDYPKWCGENCPRCAFDALKKGESK